MRTLFLYNLEHLAVLGEFQKLNQKDHIVSV